jgi:very-short-patch-repair endonuclease
VTTVPRTVFDLAGTLPIDQLEQIFNEAEIQRRTDPLSLPDLIARYPRHKGVPAARQILKSEPALIRKELEARFRRVIRKSNLPLPRFNYVVCGYECDAVWPDHRMIVELDSRAIHGTKAAFGRDRERDRILQAARWRVVRLTWRQIERDLEAVLADLRKMLAAGPRRRGRARAAGP